jgi:hypothetical protein
VATEHSGVYSNQPVPDVRPSSGSQDPLAREVAGIIQKGLAYCVGQHSFDDCMHRAVDDYLSIGLGVPRIKVDSVIEVETSNYPIYTFFPETGAKIQTGTEERTTERVGDQSLEWEHVPWSRFGWEPCNHWKNCDFIYIRHPMKRSQAKERFGRDIEGKNSEKKGDDTSWKKGTIDVFEVWDKREAQVLFISEGESTPLEINPDPLELMGFYPVPPAMMLNLPSDELIPKSDYDFIEPYDTEINRLQERRMMLLEQIKAAGAYDSGLPELAQMLNNDDGKYTAVANLGARAQATGGPDNLMLHLPIEEKVRVLDQLTQQINFVKSQVDEILGISDIVRGVTAASESATAQEIKGRWVGIRLTRKRETVQYTVREMMKMMAKLLASHITTENLERMTQTIITPEIQELLQNDMLMEFSIDIESDSTIAKDVAMERETHQEMLNGVAQFSQSVLPMVQQNIMPAGVAAALLATSMRPYSKYDRNLADQLAEMPGTMQQLKTLTDTQTQTQQSLEQCQQQLQQAQQESEKWRQTATMLQEQATEATSNQRNADAAKKDAETEAIRAKLPADKIEPQKTASEIDLNAARADEAGAKAIAVLNPPTTGIN